MEEMKKPMRVTTKEEFLVWATQKKGMTQPEALKVWEERVKEFKDWGQEADGRLLAQASMAALKKRADVGKFHALVMGYQPKTDWNEIARKAAANTDTPDVAPWDKKGNKIGEEPDWQVSVYLLGYEVTASGEKIGDAQIFGLSARDNMNEEKVSSIPEEKRRTTILEAAAKMNMNQVVEFTAGKGRSKSDEAVTPLFVNDGFEAKTVTDDDLVTNCAKILERIAPVRRVTYDNIELFKNKPLKNQFGYMIGTIGGVTETDKLDSRVLTLSDGVYDETINGWMDKEIPRTFPDQANDAVIIIRNTRINTKDGQLNTDVIGVVPSVGDMKRAEDMDADSFKI